jgi:signal transduction histidine kinase
MARFNVGQAIVAPFRRTACQGRCYFLDVAECSEEELHLSDIAAFRIGAELDMHQLRMQHARDAGFEARARISQDLHDGVLQSLTAVAMKLEQAAGEPPARSRDALLSLRDLIVSEHQRIRELVNNDTIGGRDLAFVPLLVELRKLAAEQTRLWNCDVSVAVAPAEVLLARHSYREVRYILQESTANAVRHGKASRVSWDFEFLSFEMRLRIRNDGKRIPDAYKELAKPRSLNQRITKADGSFTILNSDEGVDLEIRFPPGASTMQWQ